MTCPNCNDFENQKLNGTVNGKQRFKCKCCGRNYTIDGMPHRTDTHDLIALNKCKLCGENTPNPHFCSRSCSATYTNRLYPKKKLTPRYCKYCGIGIPATRSVCDTCNPSLVDWSQRTLGDVRKLAKHQANAQIRSVARSVYRNSNRPYVCFVCGYDKHVEICHIQPINTFLDSSPVSVVSHINNLIALCPNCHWEFDNHLLELNISTLFSND